MTGQQLHPPHPPIRRGPAQGFVQVDAPTESFAAIPQQRVAPLTSPLPPAPAPAPPAAAVKPRQKWPWITAAALFVIILIGSANGGPRSGAPTALPTPLAPPPAAPPAIAPPPAVVSPAEAIVSWRNAGGLQNISAIADRMGGVATAAQAQDVSAVNAACVALQSDVESAQGYAPIPDAQAQASWARALAFAARSATDCIAATESGSANAGLLGRAADEIKASDSALTAVTTRIKALSGS